MRNILKKTAIATAMGAALAAPAFASDFVFTDTVAGDAAKPNTVVFADIIFGEGNPGVGSEETLLTGPESTLDLTVDVDATTGSLLGDTSAGAGTAIVKFTLGGGAIFGEDLSTSTLAADANGGNGVFYVNGGNNTNAAGWQVTAGGGIGDNSITIEIESASINPVTDVSLMGYKVKNLTSVLKPSSSSKFVEMGVEYVEFDDADAALAAWATATPYVVGDLRSDGGNDYICNAAHTSNATGTAAVDDPSDGGTSWTLLGASGAGTSNDSVDATSTDDPLVIFGSSAPVDLNGTAVDFMDTPYIRINVGATEYRFTGDTTDGRTDFDATDDDLAVDLGTFQLELLDIDNAVYTSVGANERVKKESGDDFDFQGGDDHFLNIAADNGTFVAGGRLFLATDDTCVTEVFGANVGTSNIGSLDIPVSGDTDELTTEYNLCYSVPGDAAIPEVSEIDGEWRIEFFNTRYDWVEEETGPYGPLLRNGCVASFFNVPRSDNDTDTAFVRLTNTSVAGNAGDIRGTMYDTNGDVMGGADNVDVIVYADDLAHHATAIFYTGAADAVIEDADFGDTTVYSINTALSITDADYGNLGRGRLILKGAFDTCEGLGLIRNSTTGALFNMTATTMGNEAGGANDGNNSQ